MNTETPHSWLHRVAVLTACVALVVTIASGALVTTKGAGMAFADYPSSDGHNMFLYPLLQAAGNKFLEHFHRLAGATIGLLSIVLAATALRMERRGWVKALAVAVLLGVIAQGLLGGMRVLRNDLTLASLHGSFAALVVSLMVAVAVVTSRGWFSAGWSSATGSSATGSETGNRALPRLKVLAFATCGAVFVQYVLGGLVRHRGMHLYEHLGFALISAVLAMALAWSALQSRMHWLRHPAFMLCALILVQLCLGFGAWISRFGSGGLGLVAFGMGSLGLDGYVPVQGSSLQVSLRTGHVLGGMLLFITSIVMTLRILRAEWLHRQSLPVRPMLPMNRGLELTGGRFTGGGVKGGAG